MSTTSAHLLDAARLRDATAPFQILVSPATVERALLAATMFLLALWHGAASSGSDQHAHPTVTELVRDLELRYQNAPGMGTDLDVLLAPNQLFVIDGWVRAVAA